MQPKMPLRYRISSWRQLPQVKSNNSKHLHVRVTDFVQSDMLTGFRITIEHDNLGVLFAYVLQADGRLITHYEQLSDEFTPSVLLNELKRYGFLVDYNPVKALNGNQVEFLMTIRHLQFDKIRVISVWDSATGVKQFTDHVVAFKVDPLGDWLNSGYSPSIQAYQKALSDGHAFDITGVSEAANYDWSWLVGWVGDIDRIVAENAEMSVWQST